MDNKTNTLDYELLPFARREPPRPQAGEHRHQLRAVDQDHRLRFRNQAGVEAQQTFGELRDEAVYVP
jgi:hypothetical protein